MKWLKLLMGFFLSGVLMTHCQKAGFDGLRHYEPLFSDGSLFENLLRQMPLPWEWEFNTIAYMSCPQAGRTPPSGVRSQWPIFNLKVLAGDHRLFKDPSVPVSEEWERLVAGVRLRPEWVNWVQNRLKRTDVEFLEFILKQSFFETVRPAVALINFERDSDPGGFGYDERLISLVGPGLSDRRAIEPLWQAWLGGMGRRVFYWSQLPIAQSELTTVFSWAQSELALRGWEAQMRQNLIIVSGFAPSEAISVRELLTPNKSDDPTRVIAGYGYKFLFNSVSGPNQTHQTAVRVERYDLWDPQKPRLGAVDDWRCFDLMIVRDVDRIIPNDPFGRPYCWNENHNTCAVLRNGTSPNGNTVWPGVRRACPPFVETQVLPADLPQALERLNVAYQVLPAYAWEINTHPRFMCAVIKGTGPASCYEGGDASPQNYVLYGLTMTVQGQPFNCGPESLQCPAYVSICYRVK